MSESKCRPREHLIAFGKKYPDAWKQADRFRAAKGGDIGDWADWCYLPLSAAYAIVSRGGHIDHKKSVDIGCLGALMAWRVTQGIYRYDSTLYESVLTTPLTGDLPSSVLYHFPEWCVYIETPGMKFFDFGLHGFFAHLEYDVSDNGRRELRLVLDTSNGLLPWALHLGKWPLLESIQRAMKTAARIAQSHGVDPVCQIHQDETSAEMRVQIEPLVSLALYLCARNAEIGDGTRLPKNPKPTKTKRGLRIFAPDKPTIWDVGVRLGAALRDAMSREVSAGSSGGGTHASPRAHVRRAHWHHFLMGPRDADVRKYVLKWLPPIPVNLDVAGELPVTIREVKT